MNSMHGKMSKFSTRAVIMVEAVEESAASIIAIISKEETIAKNIISGVEIDVIKNGNGVIA